MHTHVGTEAAAVTHSDRRTDIQLLTISVERGSFMAPQCRREQQNTLTPSRNDPDCGKNLQFL